MRSYTIGNTHSNHILPLYKRSSLSKYRYNLSNNPSPFWLSNKDQYNSLYLEAVYRQGLDYNQAIPCIVSDGGNWNPSRYYPDYIKRNNPNIISVYINWDSSVPDVGSWGTRFGVRYYAYEHNIYYPVCGVDYWNGPTTPGPTRVLFCAPLVQVFDHYNYHYEIGALYQEINKLPSSTLNNTSSGVTFSIYA